LPEEGYFRVYATALPCAARDKAYRSFAALTVEQIMRMLALEMLPAEIRHPTDRTRLLLMRDGSLLLMKTPWMERLLKAPSLEV
ncbi:MAG: hypothetical protein IKE34_09650, partial [Paenibacillus sp.]|nr:hypothetical protein [Paenibacillus sp.]